MSKQEKRYMSLVKEYNTFISTKPNTDDDLQFEQVKEELLEFVNRFLYIFRKKQVFVDLYDKRMYEDKEKISARLLHNINRQLPIDETDCSDVYFEERLMLYMPWGSWVTFPQACVILCITILGIWVCGRLK